MNADVGCRDRNPKPKPQNPELSPPRSLRPPVKILAGLEGTNGNDGTYAGGPEDCLRGRLSPQPGTQIDGHPSPSLSLPQFPPLPPVKSNPGRNRPASGRAYSRTVGPWTPAFALRATARLASLCLWAAVRQASLRKKCKTGRKVPYYCINRQLCSQMNIFRNKRVY